MTGAILTIALILAGLSAGPNKARSRSATSSTSWKDNTSD